MLTLYRLLLRELVERGAEVVVWKNSNEVASALDGDGDIDLYVRSSSRESFLSSLSERGFIEAFSPYAFPAITHFYGHDIETGRLCHLHCYFRLVTGESHVKQFVMPLDSYLESLDCKASAKGFYELEAEIQHRLGTFRRQIKVSCLPGLLLYLREREGYASERLLVVERMRVESKESVRTPLDGWMAEVHERDSLLGDVLAGIALRWQFRAFARLTVVERFAVRYGTIVKRLVFKLAGRKKRFSQGVIVAVVGLDGSGKSTAVEMLHDWLAQDFEVRTIHYGLGAPSFATAPLRALLVARRWLPGKKRGYSEEDGAAEAGGAPSGWLPHVRYLGLAWERNRVLAKANRLTARGVVVVSDRWRSLDAGKMDSPRLDPVKASGLRRRMAVMERRLYERSPDADVLLRILVDQQTAIQRNRERDKPGKETDEGIAARFRVNSALDYRADSVVKVDGTAEMSAVHAQMRQCVWDTIVRRNYR